VIGFVTARTVTRIATRDDARLLGAFCTANPAYDVLLTGEVPDEREWVEDFLTDLPPESYGWTATHKLISLATGTDAPIVAVMDVSENMLAPGIGHIGLFQVADALHGSGLADELYTGLEMWLAGRGMDGFRLGVLQANPRGQRFWARHGYSLSRTRPVPDGSGHVTNVLMKSLTGQSLADWQRRVPRDHADTA
jgi:GNAT superfamily N-acetyltransferase